MDRGERGRIFAHAYKHLTKADDKNDNEEGARTREIKQAAMPTASTAGPTAPDHRGHGEDRGNGGHVEAAASAP